MSSYLKHNSQLLAQEDFYVMEKNRCSSVPTYELSVTSPLVFSSGQVGQIFQGLQFEIDMRSQSLMGYRIHFIRRPKIDAIVSHKLPRCYDSNVFMMHGKTALSLQSRELKGFQLWSHTQSY